MPRKSRVWYPGATYHVMCRGNHRTEIFRSEVDYLFYLDALRKTREEKSFQIHGYCLMGNHVHLHIETDDINISTIMKKINMLYAVYFNNKYKTVGHLFQDRFKSELIENDPYNLVISRYIHLNPVRAKITTSPVAYRWSSYAAYLGYKKDDLVTTEKILAYFPNSSRKLYQKFVESGDGLILADVEK